MVAIIFEWENGNTEEWIGLDHDGSVVHHCENSGWKMHRKGIDPSETRHTVEEAKIKWPRHAAKIDAAIKAVKK